jgi:hypothetical protein
MPVSAESPVLVRTTSWVADRSQTTPPKLSELVLSEAAGALAAAGKIGVMITARPTATIKDTSRLGIKATSPSSVLPARPLKIAC